MKNLLLVIFFFGSCMIANAQAQFAVGLKGGPNFANIDASEGAGNYKNRTGFHLGAFALIKVTKIGIQPEVIFSQQGSRLKFSGSPDLESNFSYFNVPIMLKLYTIAGINLQAGPQFGFLMKSESNYNPLTQQQLPSKEDFKDAYKKSDVGLGVGVGWDLPFGLTLDARYNLGLSKINEDENMSEIKNKVWQFSLGYKFVKLGK